MQLRRMLAVEFNVVRPGAELRVFGVDRELRPRRLFHVRDVAQLLGCVQRNWWVRLRRQHVLPQRHQRTPVLECLVTAVEQ